MSVFSDNKNDLRNNLKVVSGISNYTFEDLKRLKDISRSDSSRLAVVAHIDVNAFYAQVEQIKHGFSRDDPIICAQWKSIIAVSYAARKYGISRLDTLSSAIKKCPHIIPLHTAVFRKGESFWRNVNSCNPDSFPDPNTHKVCLDPYRRESRKLHRIFRKHCRVVEKASVDESFMNLGFEVFSKAIELFPELQIYDQDQNHNVKMPPIPDVLPSWITDNCEGNIIKTTDEIDEILVRDWDDIFMIIGSILTLEIRKDIVKTLGYTTSCGVARVKTLAKLASDFKKPDNQTIVRNSSINEFLKNFHVTDFWGLGGKTGELITDRLDLTHLKSEETISYIRDTFSLDILTKKLNNDKALATRVFQIVRGELYSPFGDKKDPSMCSAKNFRAQPVENMNDALDWIKVFVGDLTQRIKEMNEEENLMAADKIKTPRLISLHYTHKNVTKSKQMPMPQTSLEELDNEMMNCATKLFQEINSSEGDYIYPLLRLSLTLSKLEIVGNKFIDKFFKRATNEDIEHIVQSEDLEGVKVSKKKDSSNDITSLLFKKAADNESSDIKIINRVDKEGSALNIENKFETIEVVDNEKKDFFCTQCNRMIIDSTATEHNDFHFALKYSSMLNGQSRTEKLIKNEPENEPIDLTQSRSPSKSPSPVKGHSEKPAKQSKRRKISKGQSKLPF